MTLARTTRGGDVHPLLLGAGALAVGILVFKASTAAATPMRLDDEIFLRVLPQRSQPFGHSIIRHARRRGIEPVIVWAVMDHESKSGELLTPRGPGGTGDGGKGHGLMQIDSGTWADWLEKNDWRDPDVNIGKGVDILADNFRFFQLTGSMVIRGTRIGGSGLPDPRPLYSRDQLEAALAAYNAGPGNVLLALAQGRRAQSVTQGGVYVDKIDERLRWIQREFDAAMSSRARVV